MTVSLKNISKTLGGRRVLDGVSLSVDEGEVVGLLGPNGAGKTTLMKILTGIWKADEGEVSVCGINMRDNPHAVTPMLGYLPENNPLYDEMYVREYLLFMAGLSGMKDMHRVEDVIRETGLMPEVHKKIGWLSKGYRQRVGIAQAILQRPRLLILDEPTTGLDPNQLEDIRVLIRRVGQQATVLLSTHILQEVKFMCNRVLILDHGQIKADISDPENVNLEQLFREKTT
ncbi:MAG: ATP-binding cassette domain-containing protein [Paludibacteraceae bacterium]|nr:ATP-binding cassette domain-containing protein [Paludibacteraceae bacterium]